MRTQPIDQSAARIRIFIISQHPIYCDALRTLLVTEQDFEIIGMDADCLAAVAAVRAGAPDVVLIDLAEPQGNPHYGSASVLICE